MKQIKSHFVEYFQVGMNMIISRLPFSTRHSVYMKKAGEVFEIHVEELVFHAPGIRRWRKYRYGVDARLASVARRYDLDNIEPKNDGEWVVDVGGYMGEWSLYMLRKGFNVLVIEPDPNAALCLKANLTRHAPIGSNWRHDPRVALNERKTVEFHSEPTNADGSVFPSSKFKSTQISLNADTLDFIVSDCIGDQPVRVIKMDAEGAEPEVLMGATKTLVHCERIGIDAGAERMGESTADDCRRILLEAGLRLSPRHLSAMVVAERSSGAMRDNGQSPRI